MLPHYTPCSYGEFLFGNAELGDKRRTKRLVDLVDQMGRHSGGSLPEKLGEPKDLKALYRLCDRDEVTHESLLNAMRPAVLAKVDEQDETTLILHDGTELDYTSRKSLFDQLGQVGRGLKRGYICHNSLAVKPQGREVIGLVNQILHRRVNAPKGETLPERRERESRESRLWVRGTEGLPADWRLVDVADQGADTFEFLQHEARSGRRFVIRSRWSRKITVGHELSGSTTRLHAYMRSLPAIGGRMTDVASQPRYGRNKARKARYARLLVSVAKVLVHPPHAKHGDHDREPMPMWAVRVWEPHPPKGSKRIEWFLLTNEPVETLEDADRVIEWYRARWVVEEFHKAMKTGCQVEEMQFTDTARLDPMIAVLSAVATTLLNLRSASELPDAKERPAVDVIDREYVSILSLKRYKKEKDLTVHEFFFALARLGGHQNRRRDKRPGWLVLWRGWTTLQAMVDGAEAARLKKCG